VVLQAARSLQHFATIQFLDAHQLTAGKEKGKMKRKVKKALPFQLFSTTKRGIRCTEITAAGQPWPPPYIP
jgi:hypothetical protein